MYFPHHKQHDSMDCGPTCLYMVNKYYGRSINIEKLRQLTEIGKEGVNVLGVSNAAEKIGYRTMAVQITIDVLEKEGPKPCILYWQQKHFVVLYKAKPNKFYIADPAKGLIKLSRKDFAESWLNKGRGHQEGTGITLLLEPTPSFYNSGYDDNDPSSSPKSFSNILQYLIPYKKSLIQLIIGLFLGSLLQMIFPFLTQSIVDVGVNTGNIHFVYLILFAQLALFVGRLSVEFIRSWILYHISSRINIAILTDFLIKLMKLPINFFDSKKTGDIMQRMSDHHRIQTFLTGTSLNTLFSIFNLLIFSVVLAIYNLKIFGIFILASVMYIFWIFLFLKKRKQIDYKQFDVAAEEQSKIIQIVQGMQEIKLNGCEKQKRWEWERLQAKTFRLGIKGVALSQWQQTGAFFINEGKNIFIIFLSAEAVINGEITLGGMLAIQYIAGQLNGPIEQMIGFVQSWQLAKISLDRLNEIHGMKEEYAILSNFPKGREQVNSLYNFGYSINSVNGNGFDLQDSYSNKNISLSNVSFTYPGAGNEAVLKNINLVIPQGKTTAIVGSSGSGKTTLLKLLLKFYETHSGSVKIGSTDLQDIEHNHWRMGIGTVMQESFIFSDSIAGNIALGADMPDMPRLQHAASVANIIDFVLSMPLGFNTKIGAEGNGISAGQKQRILIARAVYKDPQYIFLDEATNSLDANNELVILKNLSEFLKDKTAVIVAHRLSTVKNADQIVVLNNGLITETGTHVELTNLRGEYFTLVKNQLELGE